MEKLRDRLEGVEASEVVELVSAAVDRNAARIDEVEARCDVLELGRDLTDTDLMWVALDERLLRVESQQESLLGAVRELLARLP